MHICPSAPGCIYKSVSSVQYINTKCVVTAKISLESTAPASSIGNKYTDIDST